MAIQQQQTSRGGLITALVFAIIFALGFLIWAIMENSNRSKSDQALTAYQGKYKNVITDAQLSDAEAKRNEFGADRKGTLIESAEQQRRALVRLIARGESEQDAQSAVAAVMATVNKAPYNVAAGTPLADVVNILVQRTQAASAAQVKAEADAKAAQDALAAAAQKHTEELAARDKQVADSTAAVTKSQTDMQTGLAEKDKQVQEFSGKAAESEKSKADAVAAKQVELDTQIAATKNLDKLYRQALATLARYRPNVKDATIRNVDAVITNVAADSICYINLGFGNHVVPGLTFEVYDKLDGIPKLGDGTSGEDMPKGKASIEIIRVGQNESQCRILNVTRGVQLSQGDLCANLVYDKNIKPLFYVYGKFDTDYNGVPTDAEAEVVKKLITSWGGRIAEKPGVDVDYVLMGKEPSLPSYTPEELAEPIPAQKMADAKAALAAYEGVRNSAVDLHIPVMNQNRFLYYTGYFDASKK